MQLSGIKERIRSLRKKGLTYREINAKLKTELSKATVSGWCRDIKLSKKQQVRIEKLQLSNLTKSRLLALKTKKIARDSYLSSLEQKYSYLNGNLEENHDSSIVALALLYLTEGTKQPGKLTFGNSDPRIIRLFLKLLRKCFVVDESKFRCTVQCRADQPQADLEKFWAEVTEINERLFYKTRVDTRSVGKITAKANYMGVCRIDYFSGSIYNELQVIAIIVTS